MLYHLLALGFALLLPVMLFVSGAVARRQRSASFQDVMRNLFSDEDRALPQLDLVGAKYDAPLRDRGAGGPPRLKRQPHALMLPALIYAGLTYLGFELLLVPISELLEATADPMPGYDLAVRDAFIWTNGSGGVDQLRNTVAVACMGFLGSYVANARVLVKQTMNMELNGMSFARAALLMIMGATVALVSYRALYVSGDKVAGFWLGLGFLIGYAPETGLAFLMRRIRVHVQKGPPDDFFKRVASTPVEIIDGIDSDVAYRLEQNNIEDVQNLATTNPLELSIETPYGFFECFDWVIQAQLCVVTGMETFLELRRHGVRTIFDLERAVMPEDAPEPYVLAIGAVLVKKASDEFKAHLGGPGAPLTRDAVVHAVAVSLDDLHVHRLRTLWFRISNQIGDEHDPTWLHRTAPVPGDRPPPPKAEAATRLPPRGARLLQGVASEPPKLEAP